MAEKKLFVAHLHLEEAAKQLYRAHSIKDFCEQYEKETGSMWVGTAETEAVNEIRKAAELLGYELKPKS